MESKLQRMRDAGIKVVTSPSDFSGFVITRTSQPSREEKEQPPPPDSDGESKLDPENPPGAIVIVGGIKPPRVYK